MYWSASIETSAPCRLSRMRTRGLPPAMRVRVCAMSSKTWIRSSAFFSSAGDRDAGVAADGGAQLADLGELGKEGDQVRREVGEVGALGGAARVAGLEIVLDQLAEALVGEGAILLDEAAVEDADLADHGEVLQLLEQARLADPGLARHDRELAVAGDRGVQAPLELGELLLPADEDGGRGALDDAARREDDRHAELVGREARPVAPQGLGDLARLLGALARVLLEAAQDDVLELLADLGPERPRRLRDLVDDAVEDRLDLAREGRLADEALVEDDAERVDVGAAVEGARGDLLGGEVGDRADERARSWSGATRSRRGRGRSPSRGRGRPSRPRRA